MASIFLFLCLTDKSAFFELGVKVHWLALRVGAQFCPGGQIG